MIVVILLSMVVASCSANNIDAYRAALVRDIGDPPPDCDEEPEPAQKGSLFAIAKRNLEFGRAANQRIRDACRADMIATRDKLRAGVDPQGGGLFSLSRSPE